MIEAYANIVAKYPVASIEDGLAENDWTGFKAMTERLGKKIQIVGDDLFVTNVKYLQRGINEKSANAILIKVNQIGSLSETLDTVNLAKKNKFHSIMSHRSGETEDVTIAHLGRGDRYRPDQNGFSVPYRPYLPNTMNCCASRKN